jgi:LysM repeat protein
MKMKLKIPQLKIRKRKKLRASATMRRPLRAAATEYEEMAEPNMKLSRALLIVLVLHVVAVSGVIAFNAIKTRQAAPPPLSSIRNSGASVEVVTKAETASIAPTQKESVRREEVKRAQPVLKDDRKKTSDSGKTYTVAKGDNPVTIAKKLKVPYDDLMALNHIDDPRKLKIGQKLLLPSKPPKAKKANE